MLETYAKKRNFNKTAEPSGKEKVVSKGSLSYVIQKHSASRLHYDFRLECGGVLLSWAVPKGPSLDPGTKRLAVMVEDHPLAYGGFEGIIPAGQYGGGEVIVWDRGTYCPDESLDKKTSRSDQEKMMRDGLKKGKLAFTLYGEKLHGSWTLVRTQRSEKDWLLIKHKDEYVDTDHDVTEEENSVLSKKTIASLQKTNPDRKNSTARIARPEAKTVNKSETKSNSKSGTKASSTSGTKSSSTSGTKSSTKSGTKSTKSVTKAAAKPAVKKKSPPAKAKFADVKPMLASLSASAFSKEGWIYEPKFDGIRAIAYIQDGQVTLKSRGGLALNHRFPALIDSLEKNKNIVVDGEIVALDKDGRPSFQLLQSREGETKQSKGKHIVYYVFDMLADGSGDLTQEPLSKRKSLLKKALKISSDVKFVDDLHCDGETAFDLCIQKGLEGIVAKRQDAVYQPGRRSPDWMKVKATQSAEFVICGYSQGTGSRLNTFGSLLLGYYKNGKLLYAGGVGTGFNQDLIKQLLGKMKPLERKSSPFNEQIKDKGKPIWVQPKLVAEIKYAEWTADGRLRVPVFMRLREDIKSVETGPLKEIEPPVDKAKSKTTKVSAGKTARGKSQAPTAAKSNKAASVASAAELSEQLTRAGESLKLDVEGHIISFSHLDKVLWPGAKGKGLTKRDYAQYLISVAPYLLPHLKDRPLTLVRFPNGVNGQRFFQKHWDLAPPAFLKTFEHYAEHAGENHRFLLCDNLATLLWLAQIADLELHTSHARIGKADDNASLTQTYTDTVERIERSTLNYPDYLVLDLDPYIYSGKEAKGEEPALNKKGFKKVCELALALRDMLADLKIDTFVKTSGRTGLHIYVPIVRNIDYDQVRAVAQTIGQRLLSQYPQDVTMDWAVVKRTGKIFFDHNMNARTKTLASIYSPRMSETGTVSVPVEWDELTSIYPDQFTILNTPDRLARIGDLWKDILQHKSDLKKLLK